MNASRLGLSLLSLYFAFSSNISSARTIGPDKPQSKEVDPLTWKVSHSLLTSHFGILSEADLGVGAGEYRLVPYDPETGKGAAYWQCFPTSWVSLSYDTWRDNDSMGRSDVIVTICSFEIQIRKGRIWNDYLERRAHEVSYCRELAENWKKITHNEPYVCLHGEAVGVEKKTFRGKRRVVRQWVWKNFKTRKGCYSHFADDCFGATEKR